MLQRLADIREGGGFEHNGRFFIKLRSHRISPSMFACLKEMDGYFSESAFGREVMVRAVDFDITTRDLVSGEIDTADSGDGSRV